MRDCNYYILNPTKFQGVVSFISKLANTDLKNEKSGSLQNQFCISKNNLIQLFWKQTTEERLNNVLEKFSSQYSILEMSEQIKTETGEVGEYFKTEMKKFRTKTENVEIAHAITLADFYFPEADPFICFEMKSGFKKDHVDTYKELFENMDHDTEIDVLIKKDNQQFKFQLKQYPEEYKDWSVIKVIEYLDNSILPTSQYNNDSNRDLIIAIYIQPKLNTQINISQDFKKIHQHLVAKEIKLLEINFLFNLNIEFMVWHQVFPQLGHYKIPWQKLSHHRAKRNMAGLKDSSSNSARPSNHAI